MSKAKQVSYKGIPAKHRAQVAKVLRTAAFALLPGMPRTPQKVWAALQESWAAKKRVDQNREAEIKKTRAKDIKDRARKALEPALGQLGDVRDMLIGIEDNSMQYLDHTVHARAARLMVEDVGKALEEALRELAMIPKIQFGYFVDDLPEPPPAGAAQ